MKLIMMALFALGLDVGQGNQGKLTPEQVASIERANQQANTAQLLARIAELEGQVARLQVQVTIAQACSQASLKLSECEVKQDGVISKRAEAPAASPAPAK